MGITVRIKSYERGLLFRYGEFVRLLEPGRYRLWRRLISPARAEVEVVSMLDTRFRSEREDALLVNPRMRKALEVVELGDAERAIVSVDGRVAYVLGPGRYAFWREPYELSIDRYDSGAVRLERARLEQVFDAEGAREQLFRVDVGSEEELLVYIDGELREQLGPGVYAYWRGLAKIEVRKADRREQVLDVAGQEILTADKVSLRVNLLVTYKVVDAPRAVSAAEDYEQALYRAAQLALRASVGAKTLDKLLGDKESVGGETRQSIRERAAELGLEVVSVGLRDIVLPGDMKTILNQVIEAEKRAEAETIRRREETASARSQANTAKLLADNPQLAKMRELELLRDILAGADLRLVVGDNGLTDQVRKLVSE